jgi:hypothetical protein
VGTTGESPTLTHDEHERVIAESIAAAKGRLLVMPGTGSNSTAEAVRLTKFAAALTLKDSKGVAKKVTWPLATVFGGLLDPKQNVCVKPTAFALQALTVGMTVDKSAPLAADSYAKFVEVLKKTEAALVEAGHKPRDLMDVYSFIYRTHAEKPAAAVVAVPAA